MTTSVGRGVGRQGFINITNRHLPAHYWAHYSGAGVHARIEADQTAYKILIANVQKVLGAGLACDLWQEVPRSAFREETPIPGISIIGFSHKTPTGSGTLVFQIVGAAHRLTWTPPGGVASPTVDVVNGGVFKLESSGSYLTVFVQGACGLGAGPYSNTVTFSRSMLRTPNFDPQVDQTTVQNAVYPLCSCYKATSKQPDNKCRSCGGTGIIPGFSKFGYAEITMAATDPALTLSGISTFTEFLPYRLQLAPGQLTGTILSSLYPIAVPGVAAAVNPFQFRVDRYLRQPAGTSAMVEFSINGGAFAAINTLTSMSVATGGTIQFRVTLNRTLTTDKSPFFEILRARYSRLDEPFIRILKGMPGKGRSRDSMGVTDSEGNLRAWTVPLRHFDGSIDQDPEAVLPPDANLIQQQSFLEFREGVHTGVRFAITSLEYHDPLGVFTSQGFSCRRLQPDEIQSQVF